MTDRSIHEHLKGDNNPFGPWGTGLIPIDTTEHGNGTGSSQPSMPQQPPQSHVNQPPPDVAGVLRRNQACLACRRRKLKCDAVRPQCSTCIRSYKHLLRTNPRVPPVLNCEYDDSPNAQHHDEADVSTSPASASIDDDADKQADGSGRKKRKSNTGEGKRKKDSEAERLKKRIEELESELVAKTAAAAQGIDSRRTSSGAQPLPPIKTVLQAENEPSVAQSPTAFLEMLSSAASAQVKGDGDSAAQVFAGLRVGASGSTMMNGATGVFVPVHNGTGPESIAAETPMFMFSESQSSTQGQGQIKLQEQVRSQPIPTSERPNYGAHRMPSDGSDPSRPSTGQPNGFSPFDRSTGSAPTDPIALTPTGVFNFSPAPSGPVDSTSSTAGGLSKQTKAPSAAQWMSQPQTQRSSDATAWSYTNYTSGLPQGDYTLWHASATMQNAVPQPQPEAAPIPISVDPPQQTSAGVDMGSDLPQLDEAIQQQLLMDLFWPGWPPGLPEPHIVNDLIEAFYDLVPNLPRMLNKTRLLTRMTLPPTHSNFPHPSLIHSICAIAASWCAPAVYERSSTGGAAVDEKSGKLINFQLRQAGLAKEAVHDGLNTGNRMFDVVRAMTILSRIFIDDTRMLECWAMNGLVARMILPLGLNVRSAELSLKSVMLTPPADDLEREERRAAMWFAFYHDTIASAASGWGTSISMDELSVPLPCSVAAFTSGSTSISPNPQDIESHDLFTHHPVPDPFVMTVKASILVNRVTKFARKWKNRHLRDNDDFDGMKRPEFRELSNAIACFQMSFPPELRNPRKLNASRKLDIDLISAHMLPHTATICLYEPFADLDNPNDDAARRILSASQGIVSIVQQLAASINDGSSNLTSIMHSSASVCLVTAARTLLVFYRQALNQNDNALASSIRSDVEMIRMALAQFGQRFKIGHHHSQLIDYFLDRATYPTFDKLSAHYPDHPRPGALELRPDADLGACVMNALNIKRGFWRLAKRGQSSTPIGISPYGSTPDSSATGMRPPHRNSTGGPGGARIDSASESPQMAGSSSGYNTATKSSLHADANVGENLTHIGMLLPYIGTTPSSGGDMETKFRIPQVNRDSRPGSSSGGNGSGFGPVNTSIAEIMATGSLSADRPPPPSAAPSSIASGAAGGGQVQGQSQSQAAPPSCHGLWTSGPTLPDHSASTGSGSSEQTGLDVDGPLYSRFKYVHSIQPDGQRAVFGHMPQDVGGDVGPSWIDPKDPVWGGSAPGGGGLKGRSGVVEERWSEQGYFVMK